MFYQENLKIIEKALNRETALALDGIDLSASRFESVPSRVEGAPATARYSPEEGAPFFLHSSFDPRAEGLKTAKSHGVEGGSRVFLLGFGLGYVAEAILERLGEAGRLTVFEPNLALLKFAMTERDLRPCLSDSRLSLQTAAPERIVEVFKNLLAEMGREDIESSGAVIFHQPSLQTLSGSLEEIGEYLEDLQVRLQNVHRYKDLIRKNVAQNRSRHSSDPDISVLVGQFPEVPAYVVSAGPSLDKNIELLADVGERGMIIAVDAAYIPLLKRGIEPHLAVSIESNEIACKFFEGASPGSSCLAYAWGSWPAIREGFRGKGALAIPNKSLPGDVLPPIVGGGSVSITALDLAYRLGCRPIALVGLDLCLPTGYSHCRDCPVRRETTPFEGTKLTPANGGGQVKTPANFYLYIKRTGALCASFGGGVKVYNATEGVTAIPNAQAIALAEFNRRFLKAGNDAEPVREKLLRIAGHPDAAI